MEIKDKVIALLLHFSKTEFAAELGISRPTLDSRLKPEGEWKKLEIEKINKLYGKYGKATLS